ncbi:MAG: hypothetical protein ACYTAN_16430 [Planctomycetota bacterium]
MKRNVRPIEPKCHGRTAPAVDAKCPAIPVITAAAAKYATHAGNSRFHLPPDNAPAKRTSYSTMKTGSVTTIALASPASTNTPTLTTSRGAASVLRSLGEAGCRAFIYM